MASYWLILVVCIARWISKYISFLLFDELLLGCSQDRSLKWTHNSDNTRKSICLGLTKERGNFSWLKLKMRTTPKTMKMTMKTMTLCWQKTVRGQKKFKAKQQNFFQHHQKARNALKAIKYRTLLITLRFIDKVSSQVAKTFGHWNIWYLIVKVDMIQFKQTQNFVLKCAWFALLVFVFVKILRTFLNHWISHSCEPIAL